MQNASFSYAKSLIFKCIVLLLPFLLRGQSRNLVVNPSFEERALTTNKYRVANEVDTIAEFQGWGSPTLPAKVYGTGKDGFIVDPTNLKGQRDFKARTGQNVGFIIPFLIKERRSYLEGALETPLEMGAKYYVGFWLHYHCISTSGVGIGFELPKNIKDTSYRLCLQPVAYQKQLWNFDKSRIWLPVKDSFIADRAYENFYIGNFFSFDSTGTSGSRAFDHYVAYVDDVFVIKASDNVVPPRKVVIKPTPPMPKVLNLVQFRYNSTDFELISYPQLDSAVLTLKQFPNLKILITGHTSTEGDAARNQLLSEQRAEAVKTYLISKGVLPNVCKRGALVRRSP